MPAHQRPSSAGTALALRPLDPRRHLLGHERPADLLETPDASSSSNEPSASLVAPAAMLPPRLPRAVRSDGHVWE
jgi:hypothetical protein